MRLIIWNEVIEKVNADFEGNRKKLLSVGKQKVSTRTSLR